MLQIWVGRAGSGKSAAVLQAMQENRAQRAQVLIVPEHTSHEAELELCRALGPTASRDAEVLSLQNLAGRVLAQTGGLADFTLDGGGKLLTMRLALQELSSQLRVFGNPSRRASFLQQLVELTDELYAYDVSPAELLRQVEEAPDGGDKLRDVALLYGAYDAKLRAGGRDARSRVQKLADELEHATYLTDKDVYFDGFSYFNKVEERILRTTLRQAHSVTVTLLGDKRPGQLFQNATRQRERLRRLAAETSTPCFLKFFESDNRTALGHLERHFFAGTEPWTEETEQIRLYEATTAFHEVEYAASQIRRLVASGRFRYRDIAVTARNMETYAPVLENVFRREEIPVYLSRRSDILQKPPLLLVLGALDAVTGGFEYEDMFRYLKTGLAGIDREECDLLENYVILWGIRGSMWLRDVAWTASPGGYGTAADEEQLKRINALRQRVRLPLLALHEGMKSPSSARDKVITLYRFAESLRVPQLLEQRSSALLQTGQVQLAEEYRQLWEIFCGVLDQFQEILGQTELSGEEFDRLLRLVLTQYSVGTIPATLDQVKVSEMTRNDRQQIRVLFLLGANDHVLPQPERGAGILDQNDRLFLQQHQLPLADETFDELDNELQNIYASLAQPDQLLHISYPTTDLSGAVLRPAFVVDRVKKLFPAVMVETENELYRLTLPSTALETAGRRPGDSLWQYFSRNERFAPALAAMERAGCMQRGRLSPEAVRTLYGTSVQMSASRMDRLKSCHFGYFMEYGLRAKERRTAGFQATDVGSFVHYLLEHVVREVTEQGGFDQVDTPRLHQLVDHYTDTYIAREIDRYEEKSARFRYLFSRLKEGAYAIVENVAEEMRESDFRPLAFELDFGGKDSQLPAITVREGDTGLRVVGKVDRVDGWLKDGKLYLRVVDYKTGQKAFDMAEVQYGLGIQMLLYLFTLQREGKRYFGHPVEPAGVLYLPARDVILREKRDVSAETVRRDLQKELRRSGLVLGEAQVLQAMEHSALEAPVFLPVALKKDGTITDGVASAGQLGSLGRYVDKLLHQIAGELERGNIDADPFTHGAKNACDWCAYSSACYFREGQGGDRRRDLKKTDARQFWEYIEKNGGGESHGADQSDR